MKKIYFFGIIIIAAVAFTAPSCSKSSSTTGGGGGGGGGGGTTPTIKILEGMTYSPASLTVKVNTVINITNEASVIHSVTSDDLTTFDKEVPSGNTVTYNCPTAGTFPFHCKFHAGMAGTLTVTP